MSRDVRNSRENCNQENVKTKKKNYNSKREDNKGEDQ